MAQRAVIRQQVSVAVPATSANLGPGFDCLGLALELHNTLSVRIADRFAIEVAGEGADHLSLNQSNLIFRAIKSLFQTIDHPMPVLQLSLYNRIPLGRGLGSSAAAVVAGLFAGNALLGDPLSPEEILRLACSLEGHPDNVAATLYGGLTVAMSVGEQVFCVRCPVPAGLKAVLFIPDFVMSTRAARKLLPATVSRADAIYNISRAAALVAALSTNQLEYLSEATHDRLHQCYREKIFPGMSRLFAAASEAGALGTFLSGAGSTVCALCIAHEQAIAEALLRIASKLELTGRTRIASVDRQGARLVEEAD